MKVRKMVGDVLAVRIKDPTSERVIFEAKTDGSCSLLDPNIDRVVDLFCENFSVPPLLRNQVLKSVQQGKFNKEFLHLALTNQLVYNPYNGHRSRSQD